MKTVQIKPSKSYGQRAIIYALFSGIRTLINNAFPLCKDTEATLNFVKECGINYSLINSSIIDINPTNISIPSEINVLESGTLCRLLVPILAFQNNKISINGTGSLLKRNLELGKGMYDIFKDLYGIDIQMNDYHLPISIDCTSKKDSFDTYHYYSFDGKDTSQYISGFLILLSLLNQEIIHIDISDCYSLEYILMTVDTLQTFGVNIRAKEVENTSCKIIIKKSTKPKLVSYNIEGDWSGAAGVMIYNLLFNGYDSVRYLNLYYDSVQPDKRIMDLLKNYGEFSFLRNALIYKRTSSTISPFEFDATLCPDLFPVVCALAGCISSGYSKITGLSRLTNKESNRGMVIFEEFKKYGINTEIDGDSLLIKGTDSEIEEVEYNSHNDHRIAMALIIIRKFYGLSLPEVDPCLNKSYSTFLEDTVYNKE